MTMKLASRTFRSAFTLVEVVLAILIIVGILTVVLYFYQQAAEVRKRVLEETEFITTARMFMEQLAGELRTAQKVENQFAGLEGSSNWISFVTTSIPYTPRWIIRTNESAVTIPTTDLKRIEYNLPFTTNRSELLSLSRSEKLLGGASLVETNTPISTNEPPAEPPTFLSAENNDPPTNVVMTASGPPLTDRIQYLKFRYWSGVEWVDSWSSLDLPRGVEVSIGPATMPMDATTEYPFEVFRRVIFLPRSAHPGNEVDFGEAEEALF